MDKAEDSSDYDNLAKQWHEAIGLSGKRQKVWEHKGKMVVDRYRDDRPEADTSKKFNILWSNVETLKPSLYSQQPKPQVTRRYKDKDPIGRAASEILERALEYGIDAYDFDSVMNSCVQDYLLPGRATARVKYVPTYGDTEGEGEEAFSPVVYEEAVCDYIFWKDFRHGPGRRWEEVTWIAFRSFLSKDELKKRFGKKAAKVEFDYKPDDIGEDDEQFKKAIVWEIWDKTSKKVLWLASSMSDKLLDRTDPPLNLHGFFPCPRPLFSLVTNDSLTPVPDFVEYQDQADELDEMSGRIGALVKALKVVGVYAGEAPEIARMLSDANDNQLIPVDNWAMFAEKGGVRGMIDWFPIEQVGNVLLGLYQARDKTKQELYEITGLSDIIRGASDAKETATAQRIKGQFASMRLGDRQKQVAIFARDILRLKAEVVCELFQVETLQMMTGAQHSKEEWGQIVELLRNDPLRTYRIDIETESTVKVDDEAEKASRLEFVTTIGEFLAQAVPFVAENQSMTPLVSEMLLFAIRGFKVGRQLEGAFEEAVEGLQQKDENPQLAQAQQAIQMLQQQLQQVTEGREAEMFEIDKQTKVTDIEVKRAESQAKQAQLQAGQTEVQSKQMQTQNQLEIDQAIAQADVQLKRAQALKAAEEARAQDIENDAVESGISDLVEGGEMDALQGRIDKARNVVVELENQAQGQPEGPKVIKIIRTESGLEGVIASADGGERRVVVNNTEDGMEGIVEGEDG
ncbi:MAG: hypothetical protein JKY88_09105 [Pseudomonadales bacterium]|nr:hypothetical protein [Pseudomonadales bacterium]